MEWEDRGGYHESNGLDMAIGQHRFANEPLEVIAHELVVHLVNVRIRGAVVSHVNRVDPETSLFIQPLCQRSPAGFGGKEAVSDDQSSVGLVSIIEFEAEPNCWRV